MALEEAGAGRQVVGDVRFGDSLHAHRCGSLAVVHRSSRVGGARRSGRARFRLRTRSRRGRSSASARRRPPMRSSGAAARLDVDLAIEQAEPDAGHDRGAGAGAAGERLARAALEHAQPHGRRETICMKPALTPRGKRTCCSISGPWLATGALSTSATSCTACGLPIETTATATVRPSPSSSGQSGRPASAACGASQVVSNGTCAGSKSGAPMSTVTRPSSCARSSRRRFMVSTTRVFLSVRPLLAHEAHEAARAVAALLDLVAAVAVEDAVAEIDARRAALLDDQDLVGADAEPAVAEAAHLRRRRARSARACASSTRSRCPRLASW